MTFADARRSVSLGHSRQEEDEGKKEPGAMPQEAQHHHEAFSDDSRNANDDDLEEPPSLPSSNNNSPDDEEQEQTHVQESQEKSGSTISLGPELSLLEVDPISFQAPRESSDRHESESIRAPPQQQPEARATFTRASISMVRCIICVLRASRQWD